MRDPLLPKIYELVSNIEKNQRIKQLKQTSIKLNQSVEELNILIGIEKTLIEQQNEFFKNTLETNYTQIDDTIKKLKLVDEEKLIDSFKLDIKQTLKEYIRNELKEIENEWENLYKEKEKENEDLLKQKETLESKIHELQQDKNELTIQFQKMKGSSISELNKNIRQHKPVPFFPTSSSYPFFKL